MAPPAAAISNPKMTQPKLKFQSIGLFMASIIQHTLDFVKEMG